MKKLLLAGAFACLPVSAHGATWWFITADDSTFYAADGDSREGPRNEMKVWIVAVKRVPVDGAKSATTRVTIDCVGKTIRPTTMIFRNEKYQALSIVNDISDTPTEVAPSTLGEILVTRLCSDKPLVKLIGTPLEAAKRAFDLIDAKKR